MKQCITIFILLYLSSTHLLFADTQPSSATKSLETVTLQLQWKDQFEFAGFYAAKEKGYYKDVGLDVHFKPFNPTLNIVDEVLEGRAQYGVSYTDIISRYLQGSPLVFVANFFKHSPLVLVAQKEFFLPSDLKGKKVMGVSKQLNGATLTMMFKKFAMNQNSFKSLAPTFNINDFLDKKVDAITVFTTNETYFLDKAGAQYNVMNPAAYGVPFYDLNLFTTRKERQEHPARVEHFRKASIKGWEYALSHKDEIIQLIQKKYNTQNKSYDALMYEANQIEHVMLPTIYPIGSIDKERVQLIAENLLELGMIPKGTPLNLESFIYRITPKDLKLTEEEIDFLQTKKELRYCVDPKWMPLSQIKNNTYIGMDSDYIQYFSKKLNIPFRLIPTKTWTESLQKAEKSECDILTLAAATPARNQKFSFTQDLLSIPLVLATTIDQKFINDINEMKHKSIGVVKGYSYNDKLIFKYPLIHFKRVNSIDEGLKKVAQGKLDGLVGNLDTLGYLIQKSYIGTLKVSAKLNTNLHLGYAVQKENPYLLSILNKVIDTLDERTKASIKNKWINVQYHEDKNYTYIEIILFVLLLLLIFIVYKYKIMKGKNKTLHELSTKDALSQLYNRRYIDTLIDEKKFDTLDENIYCLILLDIDNFKKINDTYGHEYGDKVIITFAKLLKENIRVEDTVSRWGGEEFLIFCPHTLLEEASYLAERIRNTIEHTSFETSWQITASIGVAQYNHTEQSTTNYIKKVDSALAKAKRSGKNKVVAEI